MLRGLSCEVTVPDKLCPHSRKGRLDGPCYVPPTPDGNALRHLLAPADRPPDPGDHRARSPHRPLPPGRTHAPRLPPLRDPPAGTAPRTRPDHRRVDLQPPRAARPRGPARSDRVRGDLVSPPLQDPQSLGGCRLRHDHPVADVVPGHPRGGAVDLPAGGPLGVGGRPGHAGPGRTGGPGGGDVRPGHGVGGAARRPWRELVGGDLAGGDRRGGGRDGRSPPRRPGGAAAHVAGAGGPVLGRSQAGAGGGARRADVADPWPGVLPGGGHGDGVGLRPEGPAAGDGLPGEDARAGSGVLVAAVDGLDRGGAAGPGRAGPSPRLAYITDGGTNRPQNYARGRRGWPTSPMGEPPDPVLPPGAPADERSPSSRPATGVALGDRLLSRLRIHHEAVRGVVLRRAGGSELGAEGAPVVEGGAAGDLPGVALGGGPAAAEDHHVGGQAGTIPQCLRLLAEADALVGLPGLSPGPPADRQRGDGGGVQDGVHPAAEAVGDDVESGERPVDRRPASDPLEWGLERGVSILPGIESDTPNADSRDYTEAKGLKCRIIAGTGAITPSRDGDPPIGEAYYCGSNHLGDAVWSLKIHGRWRKGRW